MDVVFCFLAASQTPLSKRLYPVVFLQNEHLGNNGLFFAKIQWGRYGCKNTVIWAVVFLSLLKNPTAHGDVGFLDFIRARKPLPVRVYPVGFFVLKETGKTCGLKKSDRG